MGSRGAFVDVNMNDFTFKAGGQLYQSIRPLRRGQGALYKQKVLSSS